MKSIGTWVLPWCYIFFRNINTLFVIDYLGQTDWLASITKQVSVSYHVKLVYLSYVFNWKKFRWAHVLNRLGRLTRWEPDLKIRQVTEFNCIAKSHNHMVYGWPQSTFVMKSHLKSKCPKSLYFPLMIRWEFVFLHRLAHFMTNFWCKNSYTSISNYHI